MITLAFIVVAAIFTLAAVRSSYYILWFLAGASFWGLGVWLVYNPFVVGGSPVNDIILTICFLGGLALMFGMNWRTNAKGESGFNFRIPRMFGGQSEEEEASGRSARNWRDRRDNYRRRLP